ncbi:MAG: cytochrome c [Acidimicrobiia bacterium]|nr:cytochrome c [Acidimicrobiia bacterium]
MKVFRLIALLAMLVSTAAACSDPGPETFGQELYEQTCAVCHGASGEGTAGRPAIGPGSNAVSLTDDQLRGVMSVGPGAMPSFNRLSEDQIDSLVAYMRELQGDG